MLYYCNSIATYSYYHSSMSVSILNKRFLTLPWYMQNTQYMCYVLYNIRNYRKYYKIPGSSKSLIIRGFL